MAKYSKNIYEQMVLAAKKAYPNECCGILVGKKSEQSEIEVTEIREAENQFQGQKAVHFKIDPLYLYHLEQELDPRGPDCPAILSKEDEKYMVPGLKYVIMSVQNGEVVDVKSYKKAMPPLNSNN